MRNPLLVACLALFALSAVESTAPAHPCRPGVSCRRPPQPPPPPPPPQPITTVYMRAIAAPPPATTDVGTIARFLAGSSWTRVGGRDQLRFVAPPSGGGFSQPPLSRDRAIRSIALELFRADRRTILVGIDHDLYTIGPCAQPRGLDARPRVTTCLEHRDTGGFGGAGYGGVTYGGR